MSTPVTTIVPFSSLPTCALACGHLYDANGACVPPVLPSGGISLYASCFCQDSRVTAFRTGTSGVCDDACTATGDSGGLASIQSWYTSLCLEYDPADMSTATSSSGTSSGTSTSTSTSTSNSSSKVHQSWMEGHWRWVVFIVVMVVGIVGIWVGACLFHRRYLRRKDRQYALGNPMATVRASTGAASAAGLTTSPSQPGAHNSEVPGVFAGGDMDMDTDVGYPEKRRSKLLGRRRD